MGCSGDREKGDVPMEEQWDYVVGLACAGHCVDASNIGFRTLTTSNPNHAGRPSLTSSSGSS